MLRKLRLFLRLAAEGDDPPADTPEAQGTDDHSLDDLLDLEDKLPEVKGAPEEPEDPTVALERERREARQAREELERERQARISAEQRAVQATPPRPQVDTQWEAEEAKLRDPQTSELEKWQIQSNRTIRSSQRAAEAAYFQSQDISDKTSFDRLATTAPKLYNRYQARVEEAVAKMRAQGTNAPREAVLRLFIGDDMVKGLIKPKTTKKAEAAPATVDRGRTPGARTDVKAGKSGNSEREKRRARLENQQI